MTKKGLRLLTVVAVLVLLCTDGALAAPVLVRVNGKDVTQAISPQLMGGTVVVPLRALAAAIGAEVSWDQSNRTVCLNIPQQQLDIPRICLIERGMFERALVPRTAEEAALKWAEGVKTRNGCVR